MTTAKLTAEQANAIETQLDPLVVKLGLTLERSRMDEDGMAVYIYVGRRPNGKAVRSGIYVPPNGKLFTRELAFPKGGRS